MTIIPAKGTWRQNYIYCHKQDIDNMWRYGVDDTDIEMIGHTVSKGNEELSEIAEKLKTEDLVDVIKEHPVQFIKNSNGIKALKYIYDGESAKTPRKICVTVLYGPGGTGKSSWAHNTCKELGLSVYDVINPKKGSVWFDGYTGQEAIIIDDFYGWLEVSTIFRLLDIYPMQIPVKLAFTWAKWNYVFITSNNHPRDWYKPETMAKVNQLAYFRRFHRIGRLAPEWDTDLDEEVLNLKWEKYEYGVVPVDKPPILSRILETFSDPTIDAPRPFFNPADEPIEILSAEQVEEQFRIPATPDNSEDDGIQNNNDDELADLLPNYQPDDVEEYDPEQPDLITQDFGDN